MLIKGEGGPKNERRAVSLLKGSAYDAQHAKWALGQLTLEGRLVPRDVAAAVKQWRVRPSGTEGYRTAEVTLGGEIVGEWNVLGENTWRLRSPDVDYRQGVDLKPHRAHPNYIFFIDGEPFATRFECRDAISLHDPRRRIDIGGDVGGRDKIESHNESITASSGGVALSGSTVYGGIQIGVLAERTLDDAAALQHYLTHVVEANRRLQLQGIRSSSGLVNIELEEVYITLTAIEGRTAKDEQQWIDDMGHLAPGEAQRLGRVMSDRPRETVQQVKVKVQEALRDHTRLVVLGDPGCGKTTLLKYLALTFARTQRDEGDLVTQRLELDEKRLPILLPLRDFAKHLQKNHPDPSTDGPRLLLNFLNTYFENQEIRLPDRFFADRLQQGGCLMLLDGVDEVADLPTRYRIARMVEKFTIAYPQNRYVVTSRIVGYTDAARLGEQYEVTTVRDFTWDDVVRFVTYWNRSIEIALADGRTAYAQQQARQQCTNAS